MTEPHRNPEYDAVSAGLRQALLDIHIYQSRHSMDGIRQHSVETLIDIGALSPRTMAFIKSHHTRFYGFPQRIAPDITVLDVVLGDRRLIGYADGHVELVMHKDEPEFVETTQFDMRRGQRTEDRRRRAEGRRRKAEIELHD